MRIVYMGTPAFAVPPLLALLEQGYEVAAVCTQPDRPVGRGKQLAMSPVKETALAHGVPVLQFERIRRQEGLDALRAIAPDLCVTAAFGQILSQKLLDIPRLGTVNVHASLLPRHRGPAPINWCLIAGETETGVTTMMTDAGIDTGDMLLKERLQILPEETAGELTERLSGLGAKLLLETLARMRAGDLERIPQEEARATREPMLEKNTGRVDFAKAAPEIVNLVRGVNPWPGAFTTLPGGGALKIWKARAADGAGTPGEILSADGKHGLRIACGAGAVEVLEMQAPGSRRMAATDYLRGKPMEPGAVLGGEA